MKLLVTALLFLSQTCLSASPSVFGKWQGSGRAWDTDGFKTECKTLKANVLQNTGTLELQGLAWECVEAGYDWPTLSFTEKEGKVFKGLAEVGTLVPTKLSILTNEIDLPVLFEFTLKSDDVVLYHEEWKGKDSTYYVEGELRRLP